MGRFKLGSTVINLFSKDAVHFVESLQSGTVTRMGQPYAEINQQSESVQ